MDNAENDRGQRPGFAEEISVLARELRSVRGELFDLRKAIQILTDILRTDQADNRLERLVADLQRLKASRNGSPGLAALGRRTLFQEETPDNHQQHSGDASGGDSEELRD